MLNFVCIFGDHYQQINILNRLQFIDNEKGIISFLSFRFLKDEKLMGSKLYDPKTSNKFLIWGSEVNTERLDTSFKLGYVSPELPYQSLGLQISYNFPSIFIIFVYKKSMVLSLEWAQHIIRGTCWFLELL